MKGLQKNNQIVLSASRRTDIPAFYMDWFMSGLEQGYFTIHHPYHRKKIIVPANPEKIHSIVFWSKNYGQFIQNAYAQRIQSKGYHLYFHFTINTSSEILEPGVPLLNNRLEQIVALGKIVDPTVINWRFDPICCYQTYDKNGTLQLFDNLHELDIIAQAVSKAGVKRCVTSFMNSYKKINQRLKNIPFFNFIDYKPSEKIRILLKMEQMLASYGIQLFVCCEKELLQLLPEDSNIQANSCIPSEFLMKHYGGKLSLRKDYGQRVKSGCECRVSRDIGDYICHPCLHQCLYCYAGK
jgi:hypothetical protein